MVAIIKGYSLPDLLHCRHRIWIIIVWEGTPHFSWMSIFLVSLLFLLCAVLLWDILYFCLSRQSIQLSWEVLVPSNTLLNCLSHIVCFLQPLLCLCGFCSDACIIIVGAVILPVFYCLTISNPLTTMKYNY